MNEGVGESKESGESVNDGQPSTVEAQEMPTGEVASTIDSSKDPASGDDDAKLSKNQQKKKRRLARKLEVKLRRKQQDKDAKLAKAKAQGRDLDEERRIQEERRKAGDGARKKRQQNWETNQLPLAHKSFQVCLDCSFESLMTAKEVNSLASQLRYCYASNKRSPVPSFVAATSLGGLTLEHLMNVSGYDEWGKRAFTSTSKSLEEYYSDNLSNVVYLTSDSENLLEELDDNKIYVIGGIVDRNRLKRVAFDRAQAVGVATARLPIDEHLRKMDTTRVLTCNHVFELLLRYRESKDWKKALQAVLPHRKHAEFDDKDETTRNQVKKDDAVDTPGGQDHEGDHKT